MADSGNDLQYFRIRIVQKSYGKYVVTYTMSIE